jgi:hypothetical protein
MLIVLLIPAGNQAQREARAKKEHIAQEKQQAEDAFAAAAETWTGSFDVNGTKTSFTAVFVWDRSNGQLKGTIQDAGSDIEHQMSGNISDDNEVLFLKKHNSSINYEGQISSDGRTMHGTWTTPKGFFSSKRSGAFEMSRRE